MLEILNDIAPDPQWTKPLPRGTNESWMYPICIVLGFVVAIVLACIKMWKRYKISTEPFYWFILFGVPLAIFGANFGSCVLGEPAGKPWSEFWTSFGSGLAIEWGILFVVIAAAIYFPLILKKPRYRVRDEFGPVPAVKRVSFWLYADAIMPCILIAQFIGRWGNYCNQEVYGAVVENDKLSWFLYKVLPGMYIKGTDGVYAWRQPLFFWEGIANLGMFFILYIGAEFIKVRKTGDMGAFYVLWYGALRLGLEPLRDQQFKSNATMVFSGIFVACGALFIILNHAVLARYRDKKLFNIIFLKPIEKASLRNCKHRIAKYENKCAKLINAQNPQDVEKLQKYQKELEENKQWLERLNAKYSTNEYRNKFVRSEEEKIYFGRW